MSVDGTLFCYGTLVIPEILHAVCGRSFPFKKASLQDYRCLLVGGQAYPGIRPEAGAVTRGVLYQGLTPRDLIKLDRYEGDMYRRSSLAVSLADGREVDSRVYVLRPRYYACLSKQPWDAGAFARLHLHRYLRALRA